MLKKYFKNSIFVAIIVFLFVGQCMVYIFNNDDDYTVIKPIKTKENIQKFEKISMDKVYICRGEKVLKKDVDKYLTCQQPMTEVIGM